MDAMPKRLTKTVRPLLHSLHLTLDEMLTPTPDAEFANDGILLCDAMSLYAFDKIRLEHRNAQGDIS